MTDLRQAAQQALEALEHGFMGPRIIEYQAAITAIKEALAQPAPAGMLHIDRLDKWLDASLKERKQRPWIGLTDEEKQEIWAMNETAMVISATEAKLKEKNT